MYSVLVLGESRLFAKLFGETVCAHFESRERPESVRVLSATTSLAHVLYKPPRLCVPYSRFSHCG